ncbi:MAG TPA: hypothetical protein VL173_18860 [Vicinamibacterales bacterium]|nr:hypothetical protein [Vicinamibacterales bacterium]
MTTSRCILAAALVFSATAAAAQSTTPSNQTTVQDIVTFLVTNQGVVTSDFDKDRAAADATRVTLSNALLASITTVPVSSASSGFSYRLNRTLGTVERASDTFGPFYVERALTAGAGEASLGFNFRYAKFTSLDGNDLTNGSFVTVANQFTDEPQPFDTETLTLNIKTTTATVFGNVGVTDRIDVGGSVPFIRLDISGARVNDYRGTTALLARATAETMGLGDVALRSKVRLTPDGPGAVAAGVEARLPTGREQDLLGTGQLAMRYTALASYETGPTSVYGNFSIGQGGIGREVAYSAALAAAATPRLTLVGEFLARQIDGLQRIGPVVAPHPRIAGVNTTRLMPTGENEMTAYAVAGFKWNVGGTWLLHGHVLVPLVDNGLTAHFTPTITLDYTFAK